MFQACVVVNVKTGGMFLSITQNGETVPALVDLMTSHARLKSKKSSALCCTHSSHIFSTWVERIVQDFETMLRLAAQMQEWDKDKFIAEAQQDNRLGAEEVAEFDKHIYLAMKRLTAGIAREIVDTSRTAGEAW